MKKIIIGLLCAMLLLNAMAAIAEGETALGIVTTQYGDVSGVPGEIYSDVTIFKGIPYAAPPVGELRWQPPQDPESWEGVRACDTYAAIAPQYADQGAGSEPYKTDFYFGEFPETSEDCLYLNITTPATTGEEKLPVYLWFHGGGQRHGYSYEPEFDAEELAKKGVIVVTIGQRLGVFGYLALPQLTEEQGTSGNYGNMDQAKAYEWVVENIAAFGGDPNNIVFGGQSGGTTKSMVLELFPDVHAQGMVLHSGLKWFDTFASLESAQESGQAYLEHIGLDPNASLEELRQVETDVFLGADMDDYVANTPASTICDGVYITYSSIAEAVAAGEYDGINILSGTTLGEATVKNVETEGMTAEEFYAVYREYLGDKFDQYDFETLVPVTDENAEDTFRELSSLGLNVGLGATYSRAVMVNRVFNEMMSQSEGSGKYYSYLFARFTPIHPEEAGTDRDSELLWAWHSSDLWYFLHSLREGMPPIRPWEEGDYALADLASSYLANFIRTGDPNGEGLPEWPAGDENHGYMVLDVEPEGITECTELDALMREIVIETYDLDLE